MRSGGSRWPSMWLHRRCTTWRTASPTITLAWPRRQHRARHDGAASWQVLMVVVLSKPNPTHAWHHHGHSVRILMMLMLLLLPPLHYLMLSKALSSVRALSQ